ncbi:AbrB family transcriptional regulator [Paenibacillus sp. B1-33]|uniref:AbrB family transcriptional regulator n=1 Tax=unclassified Paenibacillus TaxID=185978 RepID=UPI003D271D88
MTIITATPLLLLNPLFGNMSGSTTHSLETSQQVATAAYTSEMLLKLILFAAISIACARIGTKIKLPTAYLLGPATGIALVQRFGVDGVPLPPSVIHMAQLLIGTYVGMTLKPGQMTNKLRNDWPCDCQRTHAGGWCSRIKCVASGTAICIRVDGAA